MEATFFVYARNVDTILGQIRVYPFNRMASNSGVPLANPTATMV